MPRGHFKGELTLNEQGDPDFAKEHKYDYDQRTRPLQIKALDACFSQEKPPQPERFEIDCKVKNYNTSPEHCTNAWRDRFRAALVGIDKEHYENEQDRKAWQRRFRKTSIREDVADSHCVAKPRMGDRVFETLIA